MERFSWLITDFRSTFCDLFFLLKCEHVSQLHYHHIYDQKTESYLQIHKFYHTVVNNIQGWIQGVSCVSMDGYSQHVRQKLKENQRLLLLSSQERANDGWKLFQCF